MELQQELTKEYAKLHPQWMDLVNDVGASELFFIDGDSLLLDLIHSQDSRIDWSHSGQFLHLTFLVERFLGWFKQRNGNFRVIFFNCNRALWINPTATDSGFWSHLVAREAIILHLKNNTNILVDVFDSWIYDEANALPDEDNSWTWQKAMHMYPSFINTSDGEVISRADPDAAFLLRSFVFFCSSHRSATVFTSSVTIDDNRVMGFVVRPHIHIGWTKFIPECQRIIDERLARLQLATSSSSLELPAMSEGACLRRRIFTHALKKISKHSSNPEWIELIKITAINLVMLEHLPVAIRALTVPAQSVAARATPSVQEFLTELFREVYHIMATAPAGANLGSHRDDVSIADLFDGRLFYSTIDLLTRSPSSPGLTTAALGFPAKMLESLSALYSDEIFNGHEQFTMPILIHNNDQDQNQPPLLPHIQQPGALFPTASEFVTEVLATSSFPAPTLDKSDPAVIAAERSGGQQMVEEQSWHVENAPIMDSFWSQTSKGKNTGDGGGGWREVRAEQFLARFIHQYAESLEGSALLHQKSVVLSKQAFIGGGASGSGAASTAESLPEEPKPSGKDEKGPKNAGKGKSGHGKSKQGAPAKKSKADEIREANLARLKKKEEDSEANRWTSIKVQLEDWIKTDPPRVEPTVTEFVRTCPVPAPVLEAQMWLLQYYYKKWRTSLVEAAKNSNTVTKNSCDILAVNVFNQVHKIVDHHGINNSQLDEKNTTILLQVILDLGFEDSHKLLLRDLGLQNLTEKSGGKKTAAAAVVPEKKGGNSTLVPPRSSIRFMMEFMGHLLKRKDSAGPDSRVGFTPDRWQKELLDVVDRRGSALVCAPTSSGKTFISYYCMEQVLRDGPEGIAVFCSPTKALVNQVAAEVYARFGNLQSQYGDGTSVFGYFTPDYRYKPLKCRVLVTVPECLEMLLLSAQPQFESWRNRIRYVIFDEVHSIGDLAQGEIWEHVMSLVDCPILALSATVRNPQDLQKWISIRQSLQKIQDERKTQPNRDSRRSYEVALIAHQNRYADLEKSVFLPVLKESNSDENIVLESAWKLSAEQQGKFLRLHPAISLSARRIRDFGFPSDVSFEPRDSLDLYDAMMCEADDAQKESLLALNPDTFPEFQGVRRITRPMSRIYEQKIKQELISWAQSGSLLEAKVDAVISRLAANYRETMRETERALQKINLKMESHQYLYAHIVDVIFTLASQDRLPVIIFNYDAEICEKLLELLVERLEKEEFRKSQTADSVRERRQLNKAREQQARKQKLMRDSKLKEKTAIEMVQRAHDDAFVPEEEEVDRDFSFCAPEVEISKEALDIIKAYPPKFPWVRALKRGIGIHHAGLPTKYRQAVERLFRVRALQVVFATSTLSLGIHMPCKTVVFAGDSVNLNALSFRQMSGRAGRRGFDKLGKVAFLGIPDSKINRLLTGDLPLLQGSVPSSVGLVMRCENLLHYGYDYPANKDALVRLFQEPLAVRNIRDQDLKSHFRFSEELLRRQGLVNCEGKPIGFAELAAYLSWIEPANFALIALLRSGLLHAVTDEMEIKSKTIEPIFRDLLLLFATIVSPQRLHKSILHDRDALSATSSRVILEPPSQNIENFIRQFNSQMLAEFVSFVATTNHGEAQQDAKLPLSSLQVGSSAEFPESEASLIKKINQRSIKSAVRSHFAATSGQGDSFATLQELIHSIRESVYVDSSTLPYVDGLEGSRFVLNRYAVDFFEHSSLELLRKSNALHGQAWLVLNNFVLAMQGIKTALGEIAPTETRDQFVHIFSKLVDEFSARFNRITWFS